MHSKRPLPGKKLTASEATKLRKAIVTGFYDLRPVTGVDSVNRNLPYRCRSTAFPSRQLLPPR